MRPVFILTRTFAISALFVGAAPLAYAAPITEARVPSVVTSGVAAVADVLAHDVPVEVRAPIDLQTVNRVDESALEARSPEPEPAPIEARNCNGYMGCRRDPEPPVEPELEERNCNGYMGCRRKRTEQPVELAERNCNGFMGCRREPAESVQPEDRNCNGSPNCKAAAREEPQLAESVQQRRRNCNGYMRCREETE
ncbi:hypothetical protein BC629DRAFT_1438175 [Irpex lacteus]|nr:hypothetical protein BC629DRAFT_1438175 [Irpex lacteus]